MAILSSGEQIEGIETLKSLFETATAEHSSNSTTYVKLYSSLLEFNEHLNGDNTLKLILAASRLRESAYYFLQEFPFKTSLITPAINGISDWINDELIQVPREINLVLLQRPSDIQLEQILSWTINSDYKFILWTDSQGVLASYLNSHYLKQLSGRLSDASDPFQFRDDLVEQFIRHQNQARRAVLQGMSEGHRFDEAVADYLSGELQISESTLQQFLDDNQHFYSHVRAALEARGIEVKVRDVATLWHEGNELQPFYQELLLLGKLDIATHLL